MYKGRGAEKKNRVKRCVECEGSRLCAFSEEVLGLEVHGTKSRER